jgi:hypothetical protein
MAKSKGGTQVRAKQANFTAHHSQPQGHSGFKDGRENLRKSGGGVAKDQHSHMKGSGGGHVSQPSNGGGYEKAPHNKPLVGPATSKANHPQKGIGVFSPPAATGADCFRGTSKSGVLRVSGTKGAHRLGCKK